MMKLEGAVYACTQIVAPTGVLLQVLGTFSYFIGYSLADTRFFTRKAPTPADLESASDSLKGLEASIGGPDESAAVHQWLARRKGQGTLVRRLDLPAVALVGAGSLMVTTGGIALMEYAFDKQKISLIQRAVIYGVSIAFIIYALLGFMFAAYLRSRLIKALRRPVLDVYAMGAFIDVAQSALHAAEAPVLGKAAAQRELTNYLGTAAQIYHDYLAEFLGSHLKRGTSRRELRRIADEAEREILRLQLPCLLGQEGSVGRARTVSLERVHGIITGFPRFAEASVPADETIGAPNSRRWRLLGGSLVMTLLVGSVITIRAVTGEVSGFLNAAGATGALLAIACLTSLILGREASTVLEVLRKLQKSE